MSRCPQLLPSTSFAVWRHAPLTAPSPNCHLGFPIHPPCPVQMPRFFIARAATPKWKVGAYPLPFITAVADALACPYCSNARLQSCAHAVRHSPALACLFQPVARMGCICTAAFSGHRFYCPVGQEYTPFSASCPIRRVRQKGAWSP